jgi:hypothetical protein
VFGLVVVNACGADEVEDAAITELAVGSWACAPDADGAGEQPFSVRIDGDGTFVASGEPSSHPDDGPYPTYEMSGSWTIQNGDLEWGFDDVQNVEPRLEGFDALTRESTGFTLTNPGPFEVADGTGAPGEEQDFLVDAHGTDSVTLSVPGGEPWTCDRQ